MAKNGFFLDFLKGGAFVLLHPPGSTTEQELELKQQTFIISLYNYYTQAD